MDTPPKISVSGYTITFNNARTVEKALKSLAWVDELVVVDSFSTDGTDVIAAKCGARVIQRSWANFREQRQYAADQCTNDWVICVDSDEEVTPELAMEIRTELARNAQRSSERQVQGYYIPRRTWFLGRWIKHGGWRPSSDSPMRLFNRQYGRYVGDLHEALSLDGPTAHLRSQLNHYSFASISALLKKTDSYTTLYADDEWCNGTRASLLKIFLRPPMRFLRDYILTRGFLDGIPGLVIALNTAYYVFLKYVKQWERQKIGNGSE